jgi:hypothetical protein
VTFSGRMMSNRLKKDDFEATLMAVELIYNSKENYKANQDDPREQEGL